MTSTPGSLVRALTCGAALVGALSLAGCGNDGAGDSAGGQTGAAASDTPSTTSTTSSSPTAAGEPTAGGTGPLVAAAKLVIDRVPGGTLTSIETDDRGWEVEVVGSDGVERKATVNAAGTDITSGPAEQDDDADDRAENARLVGGATVDYAVAARIIAARVPGSIAELNLGDYRNQVVWEADDDSRPTVSVRVNAGDGRVLTTQTDSPDSDDD